MNILAGADFHGRLPKIPKYIKASRVDLLILAGDIPPHNINNFTMNGNWRHIDRPAEAEYQEQWANTSLASWVEQVEPKHVIYVAGNHCFLDPTKLPFVTHGLKEGSATIEIEDKKIGLLAGSMPLKGEWSDEVEEDEMKRRIHLLNPDIDVLVSHVPPYGILDKASEHYGGDKIGCISLVDSILGYEPKFSNLRHHFFGHCHEGKGSQAIEKVQFHNVAGSLAEMTL